jgi:rod shape-determining protein MreD
MGYPSRSRPPLASAATERTMALGSVTVSARQRADNSAARLLPIATSLLAVVISIQPIAIPGYAALTPAFTLMAVYHWTIYRPNLLPPTVLFLLGLAQDLLTGAPPGTTSLILLLARASLLPHRRHFVDPPFPFVWAGFTLLTAGAMLLQWSLHCLLDWALVDFRSTVFRAVLTISLFPVASFLLGRTQRALMGTG